MGDRGARCCGHKNIKFHVSLWFNLALTAIQTKQRCECQRKGEEKNQHIFGNKMWLLL